MPATTQSWSGSAAASKGKGQLILLAGLSVVLVLLLVWQVPKLLGGSSTESTPVASSAVTPVAAQATTAAAVATGVQATGAAAMSPAAKRTVIWIKSLPSRDPFVPLAGAEPAAAPAATPAPAEPVISTVPEPGAPSVGDTETPAVVPAKVVPNIAVVYTNGRKQVVGVGEYFKVRDLWFRLEAVKPKQMKLVLVDAGFTGGKDAITVRRNHPVTLANTATGVEYTLRFARATSGIATTSQTEPTTLSETTATEPATTTSTNES